MIENFSENVSCIFLLWASVTKCLEHFHFPKLLARVYDAVKTAGWMRNLGEHVYSMSHIEPIQPHINRLKENPSPKCKGISILKSWFLNKQEIPTTRTAPADRSEKSERQYPVALKSFGVYFLLKNVGGKITKYLQKKAVLHKGRCAPIWGGGPAVANEWENAAGLLRANWPHTRVPHPLPPDLLAHRPKIGWIFKYRLCMWDLSEQITFWSQNSGICLKGGCYCERKCQISWNHAQRFKFTNILGKSCKKFDGSNRCLSVS